MRWYYRCPACGARYEIEPGRYLCDACSNTQQADRPLAGVLETEWEGVPAGELGGPAHIPLPVDDRWFAPIPVGNTPLWQPGRLRRELGFPHLYLKDDTCNPSGSFKDRASYLVAAFAASRGIREIALASTGNAASSMAAVGAAAGLAVTVFLPASAPAAKRIQVLEYGATLRRVDGSYDEAYERSLEYSRERGVLSRNTAYNPLTIEGKKTVSFEIVDQLAEAARAEASRGQRGEVPPGGPEAHDSCPDHVFVPVGDGVILAGVYRGFENLLRLGRVLRMPTVWACQADGSNAIVRALEAGGFGPPRPVDTIADSISVAVPRNGAYALAKLKQHGGRGVSVSDAEILAAQQQLASQAGLFAEPSSSAAFAAFLKVRGSLDARSRVVLLITGSGLKDIQAASRGLEQGRLTGGRFGGTEPSVGESND